MHLMRLMGIFSISWVGILWLLLCCFGNGYQKLISPFNSILKSKHSSGFSVFNIQFSTVNAARNGLRLTSLFTSHNPDNIAVSVNISNRREEISEINSKNAFINGETQLVQQEWTYDQLLQQLRKVRNRRELIQLWGIISMHKSLFISSWFVHELMKVALRFDDYQFAIVIFERFHDFPLSNHYHHQDNQPTNSQYRFFDKKIVTQINLSNFDGSEFFEPHPHLVTTAIKAYGRARKFELAKGLINWIEQDYHISPDIYMISALLYVMAKTRQVKEVERIFWQEIPQRGLTHNVVTVNSLMYMYARLKRPQDALKVYEMMKREGLQCTIVTYGILVKALMLSGDPLLHKVAKDVVMSLPSMNLQPTVEIFNQMLEYYAAVNNADGAQEVYAMMEKCNPPVSMDSVSYGHLIYCLASDHKPQAALAVFEQLRRQNKNKMNKNSVSNQLPINQKKKWRTQFDSSPITNNDSNSVAINEHAYMGVLKALASLRDGMSAVRILSEMMDQQVRVDQNHVATALFACLVSNQLSVAETVIHAFIQHALEAPDIAICNLWLRIYWQQRKWDEGNLLLQKMMNQENGYPSPSLTTYRDLLKYQIMDARWDDAEKTFLMLLQYYSNTLSALGEKTGAMIDGFETLSLALGRYSNLLCHHYEEDQRYGRGWLISPAIQESWFKMQLQDNHSRQLPATSSFSVFPKSLQNMATASQTFLCGENRQEECHNNRTQQNETCIFVADGDVSSPETKGPKNNLVNKFLAGQEEKEFPKGNSFLWQRLPIPNTQAWRFLLRMLYITSQFSNIEIPSTVYCEILRALLLEKQWQASKLIVDWREQKKIRVKHPHNDLDKIIRIETVVQKCIYQFMNLAEDSSEVSLINL